MKKQKEIKLSILYTRKVNIAGEGSLGFEKETLIRRVQSQYAIVNDDGIRYVIFENTDPKESYIIVGRRMGGNKYKNYFLSAVDPKRISESEQITSDDMKKFLQIELGKTKNNSQKFNQFVKINFGIDYDNSRS